MRWSRPICLWSLVAALALTGCTESGGSGGTAGTGGAAGDGGAGGDGGQGGSGGDEGSRPTKSGLWIGAMPAANASGEFDRGWAICLWVNDERTRLEGSAGECDVDQEDAGSNFSVEVQWKNNVGVDEQGENCGNGAGIPGPTTYPIRENGQFSIEYTDGGGGDWQILGTFKRDTVSGTAKRTSGMNSCELEGGWTASPAPEPP